MSRRFTVLLYLLLSILMGSTLTAEAALRFSSQVSDAGQTGNSLAVSNMTRKVAVAADGTIYAVYAGANGIRVTRSTDLGQTFTPSTQLTTINNQAEVAVSTTGAVYVAWVAGSTAMVTKSLDKGATFSTPVAIGTAYYSVHMATDGDYVYLTDNPGINFYRSDNGGLTFSPVPTNISQVFSDVHVDPLNENVVFQLDDPTVRYFVSTDHGTTLGTMQVPGGYTFYSTAALSAGSKGHYLFVAGNSSDRLRIDLTTGVQTALDTMPESNFGEDRALAADRCGNLVTSISPDAANVSFSYSTDLGDTFAPATIVGPGLWSSVAINPVNGDVVVLHETGGIINAKVYRDLLIRCDDPATTTALVSSVNPSLFGQSVTFTATVTAADATIPTGSVTFKDGVTTLGTATLDGTGVATLTISTLTVATHSITAEYPGAGVYSASSSDPLSQVVNPKPTTTALTVTPNPVQYSDQISLSAQVGPVSLNGQTLTGTVEFFLNGVSVGSAAIDGNGIAAISPLTITLAPANYTVAAQFTSTNASFTDSSDSKSLTVNPEDARVTYTGSYFANTTCATCGTATVTLSATIKDISITTDAGGDNLPGDIRKATVTFFNRDTNTPIATVPVGQVAVGDTTTGTAIYNWKVDIGTADAQSFTIGVVVGNYYTRNSSDDDTVVQVSKPIGTNFITGGGYLVPTISAGTHPANVGSKNNVGFNVKYNKGKTNLQGKLNTIVRSGDRIYQIKGTAMTSLATSGSSAEFNGKAVITDITDPLHIVTVEGNGTVRLIMTDNGNPGSSDTLGIMVWDKNNNLWYSSKWNGTTTVKQLLGGGNLVVR